jgi:PIN domain nuclease of toxin-antitoxin system
MSRLLLDTHAWVWHSAGSSDLGTKARAQIDQAIRRKEVCISVASCWEVGRLVASNKLTFATSVRSWMHKSIRQMSLGIVELRRRQVMDAIDRIGELETRDPFDSFIISAAAHRGATLVTADGCILDYVAATGALTALNASH